MTRADGDSLFAGSIPELYEQHLVPLIFEPYAVDLAARVARRHPASVLELAAGTGVVTRRLAAGAGAATIIATDLNQAMLDMAAAVGTCRPVEWRQADAGRLPFASEQFDVVVCQFGVMFFPDRIRAFAEARRVLRAGGVFLFNVWDRIQENEFAATVSAAVAGVFPGDPPTFLSRVPHGCHEIGPIARQLAEAGFIQSPDVCTVAARSRASSPDIPALAYCQGTPLRHEIEARDAGRLAGATEVAAAAIRSRFGDGPVDARIQAHVIQVERSAPARGRSASNAGPARANDAARIKDDQANAHVRACRRDVIGRLAVGRCEPRQPTAGLCQGFVPRFGVRQGGAG